jgi:hypothetical protein
MTDNLTSGLTGLTGSTGSVQYDLSQATGTTNQMNIPMGINTLQNNITLTNVPQDVFNYSMPNGRMMGVIYYQNTCIGGFDFGIIEGKAYNLKNYGKFTNSEEGVLPIWYRLNSEFDFDLYLDYSNNRLQASVESNTGNKTLLIRGILTSGSGYIGSNVYSVDYLMENTDNAGINLISKLTATKGAVLTGGDIIIGATGSTNTIIRGNIETPDPIISTVTYSNSDNITWTNIASSAKRIGKICQISINATLNSGTTLTGNTSYQFFSVNSTDGFTPSNLITADCLIQEGSSYIKGNIIANENSNNFNIIFPSDVSTQKNIMFSITYIN